MTAQSRPSTSDPNAAVAARFAAIRCKRKIGRRPNLHIADKTGIRRDRANVSFSAVKSSFMNHAIVSIWKSKGTSLPK